MTTSKEKPIDAPLDLLCSVEGCGRDAVVVLGPVNRCARHYMSEVDRLCLSATSEAINQAMDVEREEYRKLGRDEYYQQAKDRRKAMSSKISSRIGKGSMRDQDEKREIVDQGPQLGDLMTDEEFFAKNPGWLAYKRGEDDLKEALLSRQKKPT